MIRRDYILRMIEECIQALTQIRALRQDRRWEEARQAVDAQCEKLAADDARNLAQLSEKELLARLAQDQPTQTVRAALPYDFLAARSRGNRRRRRPDRRCTEPFDKL
jgi:hypothetical protein